MYSYHIIVNKETRGKKYSVSYGNTKNITISVKSDAACIDVQMSKDYSSCYSEPYFKAMTKECIKRVALLHVLKYSEEIKVSKVFVQLYKNESLICESDLSCQFTFYAMFHGKLDKKLPEIWKNSEILQHILYTKKSDFGSAISALYAYIYSKSKSLATEKFMYLWMAFNGYYKYLFPNPKPNDKEQLDRLVNLYNLGKSILSSKIRPTVGKKVMLLLNKSQEEISKEAFEKGKLSELEQAITKTIFESFTSAEITPYGYLLTDFAYYLRCTYFHANKPLLLYCFADDMELKSIQTANRLLEDFLDSELSKCFII